MSPAYNEELKNVDQRIGRIVKAVREAGIEDETINIVTSDHSGAGKGHGGKSLGQVSRFNPCSFGMLKKSNLFTYYLSRPE